MQNIHYGDILTKFGDVLDCSTEELPYVSDTSKLRGTTSYLQNGDIIIADTAEDDAVGKATEILNAETPLVSGLHTMACRPRIEFAHRFLGYYINSACYHNQLYPFMQGVKVTSVSKGNIGLTEIRFPTIKEQHKIVSLIALIDTRISKQRLLIDSLKLYKRGLLHRVFNDNADWDSLTIRECLNYEQPQRYIVHSEKYDDKYCTPVLTANKAFILGYTNETDGIYSKGDVIIYDDFTMDTKYVDFCFKVKSSTIKMLTPKQGIDLYFMFNYFQFLSLKPEGHQRSYISLVEPMEIQIPCYEEQKRLSSLFKKIDSKIRYSECLLNRCLQFKAGLLQQIFI